MRTARYSGAHLADIGAYRVPHQPHAADTVSLT
jgi:hypothetical protein